MFKWRRRRAENMSKDVLGIDVGGSSIKGGLVDVRTGRLVSELTSVPTPQPSSPEAVMHSVAQLAERLPSKGPVGLAFPAAIKQGKACTAANVDPRWIGTDGVALLQQTLGRPGVFLNDADAAGVAEITWGAGRGTS